MAFVTPPRDVLVATLLNQERPIAARMRAIFYLRSMGEEHRKSNTTVLCQALLDKRGTALFRHEIAYVLGQMQEKGAISELCAVLRDTGDDVVVRHEVRLSALLLRPPSSFRHFIQTHSACVTHSRPPLHAYCFFSPPSSLSFRVHPAVRGGPGRHCRPLCA